MPPGKVRFCSGKGKNCSFFQSTITLGGEISFVRGAENGRKETTQVVVVHRFRVLGQNL